MSRGLVCDRSGKAGYGVRLLCRVLELSPTSFYAWAAPTATELADAYAIELPARRGSSTGWSMASDDRPLRWATAGTPGPASGSPG